MTRAARSRRFSKVDRTRVVVQNATITHVTSNFAFVRETYPQIYEDCARAESYLTTDSRSACVYARRARDLLVHHLYRLWNLPEPYRDDLAARTNEAAFKAKVGNAVGQKLNLIRRLGNS